MDAFAIVLDHQQYRTQYDRLYVQAAGQSAYDPNDGKQVQGWDPSKTSVDASGDPTTWVEPITGKLMMRPSCLTRLWETTATGIYARILKADLTLTTAAAWEDNEYTNAARVSVAIRDKSFSEEARTTTSYPVNRPFYVAPVFFAAGEDSRGYVDCGWGTAGAGVRVRLYANGQAEVRKAGVLLDRYSWSGGPKENAPQKANGQRVGFVLIPCPPNELIVYTTWGGGFVHVFGDLDPADFENEVTPEGYFYFQCVDMGTDVELAPLRFPSTAYQLSIPLEFVVAPGTGEVPEFTQFYSAPLYGTWTMTISLTDLDGVAFVPDGSATKCRLKVSFTSDGYATGYQYAVSGEFPRILGQTPDEELDVTDYVTQCRISAAMAPGSASMEFVLRDPETINPEETLHLVSTENRPIAFRLGSLTIMDGVAEKPSWDDSVSSETQRIMYRVRDKWKLLEEYRFSDVTPLDGLNLNDAVEKILQAAGFDSTEYEIDPEATGIELPISQRCSQGDWGCATNPNQTAAQLLQSIHDQYTADWFLNIVPTIDGPKLKYLAPASLGDLPKATIYPTVADSLAAGNTVDPWAYVYHGFHLDSPPIEFNQLWVHGLDPATGRPIYVKQEDLTSQDPTLPVVDRNDEWLGTIRKAALEARFLRSEAAVTAAAAAMWRRAFYRRKVGEWECEMLFAEDGVPIWVGDVVEIVGFGDFRIQSLSGELAREPDTDWDTWRRRRIRYMGEMLQERDDSRGVGYLSQDVTTLASLVTGWKKVLEEPTDAWMRRPPLVSP